MRVSLLFVLLMLASILLAGTTAKFSNENCRLKSAYFSHVTWIGCDDGLYILHTGAKKPLKQGDHKVQVNNIVDLYELPGGTINSVAVYVYDQQVYQYVVIDERGVSLPENISRNEWLKQKRAAMALRNK